MKNVLKTAAAASAVVLLTLSTAYAQPKKVVADKIIAKPECFLPAERDHLLHLCWKILIHFKIIGCDTILTNIFGSGFFLVINGMLVK